MFYTIIVLVVVGLFVAVFGHHGVNNSVDEAEKNSHSCASCGESPIKCEQECMLEAAVKDVEYYDDEELDAFIGRRSDMYDDEEVEQFRYILYTMRQEEVTGWCRSINLRGINLPDQIKDEVTMLLA